MVCVCVWCGVCSVGVVWCVWCGVGVLCCKMCCGVWYGVV